jgi:hypothetical protein
MRIATAEQWQSVRMLQSRRQADRAQEALAA